MKASVRRLVKTLFLATLLIVGACAGLWPAHENSAAVQRVEAAAPSIKSFASLTIRATDGPFVLENLTLSRAADSSILKGTLVNKSNHVLAEATFEVRAYDRSGNLLRGVEEKTIFTARRLASAARQPINSGYGVWLQGIPPDAISRLEISEVKNETNDARSLRSIPLASHALFLKEYSDIEE